MKAIHVVLGSEMYHDIEYGGEREVDIKLKHIVRICMYLRAFKPKDDKTCFSCPSFEGCILNVPTDLHYVCFHHAQSTLQMLYKVKGVRLALREEDDKPERVVRIWFGDRVGFEP